MDDPRAPPGSRLAIDEQGPQGTKAEHELVAVSNQSVDRNLVALEHVVGGEQVLPVDPDLRDRGQPVQTQHGLAATDYGAVVEAAAEPPVGGIKIADRIRISSSRRERGSNRARDARRDPLGASRPIYDGGARLCPGQLPTLIQRRDRLTIDHKPVSIRQSGPPSLAHFESASKAVSQDAAISEIAASGSRGRPVIAVRASLKRSRFDETVRDSKAPAALS